MAKPKVCCKKCEYWDRVIKEQERPKASPIQWLTCGMSWEEGERECAKYVSPACLTTCPRQEYDCRTTQEF